MAPVPAPHTPPTDVAKVTDRIIHSLDAPAPKDLLEHPDGIYINLPFAHYLRDPALSYSAFKLLNSSPPDYWWGSVYNTIEPQEEEDTAAFALGKAIHTAILEPLEYEKLYGCPPEKDDPQYKDYLYTIPQIKAAIEALEVRPKGTLKDELIDQLLKLDPRAKIFEVAKEAWEAKGLIPIKAADHAKILLIRAQALAHPRLKDAFKHGLPEVSVFWTDEWGIRQRARFDYLEANSILDLKSFANWQGRDFKKAMLRESLLRGYHMQAAHYDVGRQQARRLFAEGKVFQTRQIGVNEENQAPVYETTSEIDAPVMDRLSTIMAAEAWAWVWIFYKTAGAPVMQPIRLPMGAENPFMLGQEERTNALQAFYTFREQFGMHQMWAYYDDVWTPEVTDWPYFMEAKVS